MFIDLERQDRIINGGYYEGELVWWEDQLYRSGYASAPVRAIYIGLRGTRAGIAVQMRAGRWEPKIVKLSSLSGREH